MSDQHRNRLITTQAQMILTRRGLNPGPIDGIMGQRTALALAKIEQLPPSYPPRRQALALIQFTASALGQYPGKIDGIWGPMSEQALLFVEAMSHHAPPPPPSSHWPKQSHVEMVAFYGPPGTSQTRLDLPYPHRLAWDPDKIVKSTTCHIKVRDSYERVLKAVLDHYGLDEIRRLRLDLFGGCYNKRRIRGGDRWSIHAWGAAVDYDPAHNKLNMGRDRAAFADPAYDAWWRFWEDEGWTSLGRKRNFDFMHIQAADL